MTAQAPIVVIGSGLAGWGVVREIRRLDPEIAITMVCGDSGDFYSKPGISTALAKEKTPAELVSMAGEVMAANQKTRLLKHTWVDDIDLGARVLKTSAGEIHYSRLVLALGAEPIVLKFEGDAAAEEAAPVNTLEEYAAFRRKLERGDRVVIIGAGLVGCEFSNDLTAMGFKAVVVDPQLHALPTLVPSVVGDALQAALARQGVEWRLGVAVTAIDHEGKDLRVTLNNGDTIHCDAVLSAVGLRPHTALARKAGLEVRRGIIVDATGRTSDPCVYAMGDCAEYTIGLCQFVTPIMGAARAIAASAVKEPTEIKFAALSVQVKTTAYPIALLKPAEGLAGEWKVLEDDERGLKVGYFTPEGDLEGYVITADKISERVDMDKQVMAKLAAA